MVILLDFQGKDSVKSSVITSLLDTVVAQKNAMLGMAAEHPLRDDLKIAIEQSIKRYMGDKQRPGKHHRVQKLVDIWLVFKQIPSLRNSRGGTRTASFDTFVDIMSRYDSRAKEMVTTNTNTFRNWKSDAMPAGERNREYLKGGGGGPQQNPIPLLSQFALQAFSDRRPPWKFDS
jgi:hypothetical protein